MNEFEIETVQIPGGTFLMGSPKDELGRNNNESPQHEVTVPTFLMGRYPVTQALWRAVAALPQRGRGLNPDPSWFKGNNRPVEQVSWDDAVEFCTRLAVKTGKNYRLPTEAEWEYACRAGTTTPFYFGETLTPDLANYDSQDVQRASQTTPVDSYLVNAFGLSDMHGNVWEWCQDEFHESYEDKPEALKQDGSIAWESDNSNTLHVIRGGSWITPPKNCRSASRDRCMHAFRIELLGFRVACDFTVPT